MNVIGQAGILLIGGVLVLAGAAQPSTTQQQDSSATSAPRTDHAVGLYDEGLRRVVLIGGPGNPKDGDRDTVWSWNGTRWEVVAKDGPEGRVNADAAYEGRGKRIVVAGGSRTSSDARWNVVGDSWQGDRTGWRRLSDIGPRDHHSIVEDGQGGVLLFGGIPAERNGAWPTDTWGLQADAWTRLATEGPPGRGRTALVYDSKRRQIVLFGGVSAPAASGGAQTFLGDTWTWDGKSWRRVETDGPRGRYAHGMVFDERAGVVLLYSGAGAHRDAPLSDMWQWDGERWTELKPTGPTPGARYQPVMVYDRARERTVLYGGIGGSNDTWEWDGRRWQKILP